MSEDARSTSEASVRFELDSDRGFVRIHVRGRFPMSEAQQRQAEVAAAYPGVNRFWDMSEADLSDWTGRDIRGGIEAVASRTPPPAGEGMRVAALVSRDIDYGVARMWEAMAAGSLAIVYAVFRDEERAIEWLSTGK